MDMGDNAVLVVWMAILPSLWTLNCALAKRTNAQKLTEIINLFIFVTCFIITTLTDFSVRR
jgi:hypothetical protein